MIDLAEEHGFALDYPEGIKDNTLKLHWNAGLTLSDLDDVGFLSELHFTFKRLILSIHLKPLQVVIQMGDL